ncbi:MAG: hypothetical protein EZS28_039727 [Streblomastix strix]|uniref:Uncharacterized protein n=1 Tax=Streblomastix strix TaxID=222440 RepID=A0A5J4U1Z8_9EUKA|nr:MAG: hypothetical protein EZS28_039727 [Streblomastix strix]
MNEMNYIKDIQHLVATCKKTLILKDHDRFYLVLENIEDVNSELQNPCSNGEGLRIVKMNQLFRKAIALKSEVCVCTSLNKVIADGIHILNVRFDGCQFLDDAVCDVGIMDAKYKISYPCRSGNYPQSQYMLDYAGEYDIQ